MFMADLEFSILGTVIERRCDTFGWVANGCEKVEPETGTAGREERLEMFCWKVLFQEKETR